MTRARSQRCNQKAKLFLSLLQYNLEVADYQLSYFFLSCVKQFGQSFSLSVTAIVKLAISQGKCPFIVNSTS